MANFGFKIVPSRLQMANLSFKGAPGRIWRKTVRLPLSRIKNLSKKNIHFGKFGFPNRPNDNFGFKTVTFSFKMATFGFKMARSGLQMANLSFQRGPGQDLAENGPFAFKAHIELIKKNTAFILGNLVSKPSK